MRLWRKKSALDEAFPPPPASDSSIVSACWFGVFLMMGLAIDAIPAFIPRAVIFVLGGTIMVTLIRVSMRMDVTERAAKQEPPQNRV